MACFWNQKKGKFNDFFFAQNTMNDENHYKQQQQKQKGRKRIRSFIARPIDYQRVNVIYLYGYRVFFLSIQIVCCFFSVLRPQNNVICHYK